MLSLKLQQQESPDQAMIRMLREEAESKDGAYRTLVHQVAALAERALHKPPDSLHPSVCDRPTGQRMSLLARTFPSLQAAEGLDPWDAERFLQWVRGPAPGSGARHAAVFVLGVWTTTSFSVDSDETRRALGVGRTRAGCYGDPAPVPFREWPPPATYFRTELAFDAMAALATWDATHRAAYLAWVSHPWFA